MRKIVACVVSLVWGALISAGAGTLSQEAAALQAQEWMLGNPVMSQVDRTMTSVDPFPNSGGYSVYVVRLDPRGYLILNSDNRLPLIVSFSANSPVDLSDDSQNALRVMLLDYCARMEEKLSTMSAFPAPMVQTAGSGEDELYGPFLETSWNQSDPYNLLCPAVSGGLNGYDNRAPVGCVPTAFAQILNFHRWPVYGTGSRSYTDSSGSITGSHSTVFSDVYDWENMKTDFSPSNSQDEQEAVGELMYELGVAGEADYESDRTSCNTDKLGTRLGSCFFFKSVNIHSSYSSLVPPMEADLRAGFPCVVSVLGHAIVADGLMVDGGVTTYHINYGWGGTNNAWFSASGIPGGLPQSGVTSLRPQLMAFPETNSVSGIAGSSAELNWILPKRREGELSQIKIKQLEQQAGTWSSDASGITGMNAGWEISSSGYSGDCWYSEQSSNLCGSACLLLNEVFVPDVASELTFRRFARLHLCSFYIEVSTDGGDSYSSVDAVQDPNDSGWVSRSVSLASYAGQQIRMRFRVDSDGGYRTGITLPGIRLDNLAVTSGDWYDWQPFATDTALHSRRFSDVTTVLDDCDDFSVFEVTSPQSSYSGDWTVTNVADVGNCFYKAPFDYPVGYHITTRLSITPTSSTRLKVHTKYHLAPNEIFRILLATNGVNFTEIWSATDVRSDWSDITLDLSPYSGMSLDIRFQYEYGGSYYEDGAVWIDSISTEEVTNPELEGQPVYYTELSGLAAGTNTLAAVLTDTNGVEHAAGPSFTLAVSGLSGDRDGDGLPDWWETQYYGGATHAVTNAVAANGVNTVMETYIAGLNPTNAASFFTASLTRQALDGFVVQWSAASGRVYSVSGSTNLTDGFHPVETNILWPQSSWTDSVDRAGRFYKVGVELE